MMVPKIKEQNLGSNEIQLVKILFISVAFSVFHFEISGNDFNDEQL